MDRLKQFDKIFGVKYDQAELDLIFVNKVEALYYEDIQKGIYGVDYDTLAWNICIKLGLNPNAYKTRFGQGYVQLHSFTNSEFLPTLKLLVTIYDIYTPAYQGHDLHEGLDTAIPNIISSSPVPLGIQWHKGMFYKDEIPEISAQLIDDNFDWLIDYPLAKSDMQIALRNYSAGNTDGIMENMYKAVECVVQKVTGMNVPVHRMDIKDKLFLKLNVTESWKGIFNQFITYTNDISRHGKNVNRHSVGNEEIESCFFMSLTILRLISKKIK